MLRVQNKSIIMWPIAVVVVFVVAGVVVDDVKGDLTTSIVSEGDCVCATTNVNGRTRPSLSGVIVLTIPRGQCGRLGTGIFEADGYQWYETMYNHQQLWVAGKYLSKSYFCSFPSSPITDGSCSTSQQQKACSLLQHHNSGKLRLANIHPGSGKSDEAYAYNNIRDMCSGGKAARSSYTCRECETGAPGGFVCLADSLLSYLLELVDQGPVQVNELAGACHSCTSKHYLGRAVDLHKDGRTTDYIKTCRSMGGTAIPESNHVHCQFSG